MKIIALLLVAGGIYYILRELKNIKQDTPEQAETVRTDEPETMNPCKICGVHIPDSECIRHEQDIFCSNAHKQEYLERDRD